ncbi:hypothetical protein CHS0354_033686 [Potamilus streckersoni]|uniref:Uncharacterized protein n=1 Tax=Potamilus streckersoni TaxID=2493646 RepID=A0AAE0S2H3_9BIVA|nr:hypothetical protein CHS0354_033686 [Potamilus streckersoni]
MRPRISQGKLNFQQLQSMIKTLQENIMEKRKQNRPLKEEQPEAYMLNKVCDTERAFAESLLCELEQWSKESNPTAMKYGLDMETTVTTQYVAEKVKECSNIYIKKLVLIINKDHGFIAASPEDGVEENGILECKVAVKWSHKTVGDSAEEPRYPLKSVKINQHGF